MSELRMGMVRVLTTIMGRQEDAGPLGLRARAWMMRNLPGLITCAEFEDFVVDYHEGSLSPRERTAFEVHMEMCPMCRTYFESYLKTIALGKLICETDDESAPQELPEGLAAAILAARLAR